MKLFKHELSSLLLSLPLRKDGSFLVSLEDNGQDVGLLLSSSDSVDSPESPSLNQAPCLDVLHLLLYLDSSALLGDLSGGISFPELDDAPSEVQFERVSHVVDNLVLKSFTSKGIVPISMIQEFFGLVVVALYMLKASLFPSGNGHVLIPESEYVVNLTNGSFSSVVDFENPRSLPNSVKSHLMSILSHKLGQSLGVVLLLEDIVRPVFEHILDGGDLASHKVF